MEPCEAIEPAPPCRLHDLSTTFALIERIEQLAARATQDDPGPLDDEALRLQRGLERLLAELERPPNVRPLRPLDGASGF